MGRALGKDLDGEVIHAGEVPSRGEVEASGDGVAQDARYIGTYDVQGNVVTVEDRARKLCALEVMEWR